MQSTSQIGCLLISGSGVRVPERQDLVNSMEELVLHFGDTSNPKKFNPHALENAATRLIHGWRGRGDQREAESGRKSMR